ATSEGDRLGRRSPRGDGPLLLAEREKMGGLQEGLEAPRAGRAADLAAEVDPRRVGVERAVDALAIAEGEVPQDLDAVCLDRLAWHGAERLHAAEDQGVAGAERVLLGGLGDELLVVAAGEPETDLGVARAFAIHVAVVERHGGALRLPVAFEPPHRER